MTDAYYDSVISIALDIPGLWLSSDQGGYGIRFDSSRPLDEIVPVLVDRLQSERPWRVPSTSTIHRTDHATLTVISEIDRTVNVYIKDASAASATASGL